jgi:hypothetical protein
MATKNTKRREQKSWQENDEMSGFILCFLVFLVAIPRFRSAAKP